MAWSDGDETSLEVLVPLVEKELMRIARNYLRRESANGSMMTSDVINEAYIKLVNQREPKWKNRSHFFAVSSIIIRRILINHARNRSAGKRSGGFIVLNVDDIDVISTERTKELLALDDALKALAKFDELKAQIVELRYFGGLTAAEASQVLKLTPSTVNRHWNLAKAWLAREMRR